MAEGKRERWRNVPGCIPTHAVNTACNVAGSTLLRVCACQMGEVLIHKMSPTPECADVLFSGTYYFPVLKYGISQKCVPTAMEEGKCRMG